MRVHYLKTHGKMREVFVSGDVWDVSGMMIGLGVGVRLPQLKLKIIRD